MRNDMTSGVEWKQILFFSLPIMIGNLLQQLYNTVDGIVVGNFISETALAATGSSMALAFVFLSVAIGMGNGSGIMISQLYGAKRYDELKRAVSTALILLGSIGLIFSVVASVFARDLLRGLMNVEEGELLDLSVQYFAMYSTGLIFQFSYNTIAAILRGVGDSKATLYFLFVTAVLNLILDLVFVIVFHWGVWGAAFATVISQFVSAAVSLVYMFKKYPIFRFKKGEFVFDREKGALCLKLGIPTTFQQCIVSFGNVFIQRLVNSFGPVTMAAYTVGFRIQSYMFVPAMGFNIGMSNFTGQNIGAGRIDRIKKGWLQTEMMSIAVCVVISVTAYLLAVPLARLFGLSGESLGQAVECIRFMATFFFLFAFYMSITGVLQGSGDVLFSTLCSFTTLGARIAFAYFFARVLDLGYSSCWNTVPIGWAIAVIMALWRYLSGRWQTKAVVKRLELGPDMGLEM